MWKGSGTRKQKCPAELWKVFGSSQPREGHLQSSEGTERIFWPVKFHRANSTLRATPVTLLEFMIILALVPEMPNFCTDIAKWEAKRKYEIRGFPSSCPKRFLEYAGKYFDCLWRVKNSTEERNAFFPCFLSFLFCFFLLLLLLWGFFDGCYFIWFGFFNYFFPL